MIINEELNKKSFEGLIAVGMLLNEIIGYYAVDYTEKQIREWCAKNYDGRQLEVVYNCLHLKAMSSFKEVLSTLSERGNNTAINLLGNFVYGMKDDAGGVQKVQIVGDVKDEN